MIHEGSCHCGRVRFEVEAPERIKAFDCNCSICSTSGYLALIVPADRFKLVQGEAALTEYRFNTGTARHLFCSHCGIKAFYVPRSHPDGVSVNVRCLDSVSLEEVEIVAFNGREWEAQFPKGRAESYPQ